MKTVAIIAPQFSPCSYPPAIRVRYFTNHLEEFGWHPVVFSVKPEFMEEPPDYEFERMISPALEVIRVKALPQKWTRKMGIGDIGIRCFFHMLKGLHVECRKRQIDLIFIPGPPWHTYLIGPILKARFNIPYVMDYIDPWITPGRFKPWEKRFWYRLLAYVLEPLALRHVSRVTAVSEGTCDTILKRFPHLRKEFFSSIPYGAEASDFAYLRDRGTGTHYWDTRDGNIHFCYVGVVWPAAMGTIAALLDAVALIKEKRPELFRKIRLHFLGTSYAPHPACQVLPLALERNLDNVTEHPKRIPYFDALSVLSNSDAILALGSSDPHYTASKIFPCVLARRSLLGIFHASSSVVKILNEANTGIVVTYNSEEPVQTRVPAIYDALIRVAENPVYNAEMIQWDRFEAYSAHSMTMRLASVFDEAVKK